VSAQPFLLFAALAALVAGLKALSRRSPFNRFFDLLPVPFWCYMLPVLASSAGWLPASSSLYPWLSRWALPVSLVWLLLGVDVRRVLGLGAPAAAVMAVGFGGIVGGTLLAAFLLRPWLPADAWKALGALAAVWTGGSANMLSVKESLAIPENVFAPVVLVDGLMTYSWMTLLVAAAGQAARFDRWSGAAGLSGRWEMRPPSALEGGKEIRTLPALLVSGLVAAGLIALALRLPGLGGVLTPAVWSILSVTTAALLAAWFLSRAGRPVSAGVEKTGSFVVLIRVASLGARATLSAAIQSPVFFVAGLMVLGVHGIAVLAAARLGKIPLSLLATVSQACVGGVVSTPMVAAVYRSDLVAVGLLLAVAANAVGTYVGLATAILCRWVMG
jgi:uncharacterized membrane protein